MIDKFKSKEKTSEKKPVDINIHKKFEFKKEKEIKVKKEIKPFDWSSVIELLINTGIILAITLVAGGILGGVYQLTKEPIAIMEQKVLDEANRKAFAGASVFEDMGKTGELKDDAGSVIGNVSGTLAAKNSEGELLGYVLNITTNQGYGGDISFSMGIKLDGTVMAISITSISETAGLGMRAEEVLVPQFAGKNIDFFTVTKTGHTNNAEIDAISSATITSKAITGAVNAGLEFFRIVLGGGADNE